VRFGLDVSESLSNNKRASCSMERVMSYKGKICVMVCGMFSFQIKLLKELTEHFKY